MPPKVKSLKSMVLPLRLSQVEMELIEKAAAIAGENRAEFVRAAAKARAESLVKNLNVAEAG